jgi:putative hydrolase of the HAD superfamily
LGFEKDRALFVDDTLEVLKTARRFGLSLLVYKARATSKAEPLPSEDFVSIHDFDELLDSEASEEG